MLMDELYKFISNVGVPTAIAILMILKVNKTMERMERAFNRNTNVLSLLLQNMGCDTKTIKTLLDEDKEVV